MAAPRLEGQVGLAAHRRSQHAVCYRVLHFLHKQRTAGTGPRCCHLSGRNPRLSYRRPTLQTIKGEAGAVAPAAPENPYTQLKTLRWPGCYVFRAQKSNLILTHYFSVFIFSSFSCEPSKHFTSEGVEFLFPHAAQRFCFVIVVWNEGVFSCQLSHWNSW